MAINRRSLLDTKMVEPISVNDSKIFWIRKIVYAMYITRKDFEWKSGHPKRVICYITEITTTGLREKGGASNMTKKAEVRLWKVCGGKGN